MSDYQAPSQEWLENEAERVYKFLQPKEYAQEKRKPGVMAQFRRDSAATCRELAETLVGQGQKPFQAWHRAIRETLQQTETD